MKVYALMSYDGSPGGWLDDVFETVEAAKKVVDESTRKEYDRQRASHIALFGTPYKKDYRTGKWDQPYPVERPDLVWHDEHGDVGQFIRSWTGDYEIEAKEVRK